MKALNLLMIALLLLGGVFTVAAPKEQAKDAAVFDFGTFQELDNEAQDLWRTLVQEKGSERAALDWIMLKNNNPDSRLVDLHARVTGLVDSSYFSDTHVSSRKLRISSLMRFVLFNISANYGKEIRPRIPIPLLALKRDEYAWGMTGQAVWCAMDSKNDHLFQNCSKALGEDVYFFARKAGRASVLAHRFTGEYHIENGADITEQVSAIRTRQNKAEICTGINAAWLAYVTIYDEFILRNPFRDLTHVAFNDIAEKCFQDLSASERAYQKSLLPKKYESIIEISSAYFPKGSY